jgi:hypothetical protein
MSKEFIPYEQALELKELGFDEPCMSSRDMNNGQGLIQLPLYQQAFRWFREKYGLGHMINGIGYESFIMNIGGILYIFNAFAFETYEEAELSCLNKLIEIVKGGEQ